MAIAELQGGGSHQFVESADKAPKTILLATGLGTPAFYIRNLRDKLKNAGHDAHSAHPPLYINTGTPDVVKAARKKAEKLRETTDEPLVGVGYSLGGNHLLEIASGDPDLMNVVFTVGSPSRLLLMDVPREVTVVSLVGRKGKWDWVVPGRIAHRSGDSETVRVRPNHFVLPFSGEVFDAIAHRLGQPSDQGQGAPLEMAHA